MSRTTLGAVAPAQLARARDNAHWAAQLVAAIGETHLDALPDTSHTAMTWHDGQQAVVVRVVTYIAVFVEIHGPGRGQRCFFPEIERRRLTIRAVIDEKATATDIAARGPGNSLSECCRNSSVNGITALFQYFDAGRRRNGRR